MRTAILAAAMFAAASAPARARADEAIPEKARRLAARGRELHEQRDYERALAAFKEAYVLAPTPGLLFNLAQAYRLHGNCDDAAVLYRRYIASRPAGDERTIAQVHLAAVTRCMQLRQRNLPLDGELASLPMPPADQTAELFTPPSPRPRRFRQIGVAAMVGGGAALAGAAYLGVRAYDSAIDGDRDHAARTATAATWFGISGGAVAITGLTLFLIGRHSERPAAVTIAPAGSGGKIQLRWAF